MTDKEVIIDSVNVAGCNWLGFSQTCQYEQGFDGCKSIPNCLYKQLQRKEQECEELKKQYNCYSCGTCKSKEDYINIKRHCENAINSLHKEQAKSDRYKQALEKIEEIANYFINENDFCKSCNGLEFCHKAINIINEVKE